MTKTGAEIFMIIQVWLNSDNIQPTTICLVSAVTDIPPEEAIDH